MRIRAENELCVVSSMCVYRVPAVFDQDDEGRVVILDEHPPAELGEDIRRAVRGCPVGAISIEEPEEPEEAD
ncbi:hypothetical protein GCM10022222_79670 [Amycolatopsis ultiminotia]|uniref:Ferredoxin n=1 Tax=Amycolatopsis ultiminotia TaxID=543629 RepID=A0ABP6YGB8_9PSEU